MIDKEGLGYVSIVCGLIGYGTYLWSIMRRKTRPHAFSWIIWGTVTAIVFYAQLSENAGAGAWATGLSSAVCFVVSGFALYWGEKTITLSDWLTFFGALLAIPVWYLTKDPLWSVILVTLIDQLGFYPTFRKSYFKPYEESFCMYAVDSLKYMASILALSHFSWITTLYPAAVIISNTSFLMMLMRRRRILPNRIL